MEIGEVKENKLSKILGDGTKIDFKYDQFPNDRHFIEYKTLCDDGTSFLSGIATTKSKYYALAKEHYYILVTVEHLKKVMKLMKKKPTRGGDDKMYLGILLTESEILQNL